MTAETVEFSRLGSVTGWSESFFAQADGGWSEVWILGARGG
jgi:hypothetical protein